jgi:hypothetical protein
MHTQLSLFPTSLFPTPYSPVAAPEHDPYYEKIVKEKVAADTKYAQKPDNCVREQVTSDTHKVAPEHIHWLEEYWVERNHQKYYYWRYCWMEFRKIRRCHIGSVRSLKALGKYQAVMSAIALGQSPQEIKQLIKPKTDFSTIVPLC